MDAARDQLAEAGCSVHVVCRAKPDVLAMYLKRHNTWRVPIVSDPDLKAYSAFQLKRIGLLSFFNPMVLLGYLAKMLRGYLVRMPYPGEDVMQLGGDFILNRQREVVASFTSSNPTVRPSIRKLLRSIRSDA